MTDTKSIKTKIAALIAKAKSSEYAGEASAFMAKAEELLEKYQLDMLDVVGGDDPLTGINGVYKGVGVPEWKGKLLSAVCRYYGCRTFLKYDQEMVNGKYTKTFNFIVYGRASATVTAELMFDYIMGQVTSAAKEMMANGTGVKSLRGNQGRVAKALIFRIYQIIADREKEQQIAGSNKALVVQDEVMQYIKKQHPDLVLNKARKMSTSAAARDAAGRISLNRQTTGASQKMIG